LPIKLKGLRLAEYESKRAKKTQRIARNEAETFAQTLNLIEINSEINAKDYYSCLWPLAGEKGEEQRRKRSQTWVLISFLVIEWNIYIYISPLWDNAFYQPVTATGQLIVGLININQLGNGRRAHKFTKPVMVGLNKHLCNFILDQKQNQSRPIGIWSVCHSVAAAHGSHRTWSSSWSTILRTACVLCCQFVCGTMLVCLLLLCSCCCYLSCNHGTFVIQPLFRHALSMPQAFPGGRGPALRNAKGPRQRIKWATLCSLHQAAKQF